MIAALLGAGVSALLFSIALLLPLAGFAAGFIAAVPLSQVRLHAGRTAAACAILLAAAVMAQTYSPLVAGWYLAQCGLLGFLVPELALRGFNPFRTVLWSTAGAVALTALLTGVISLSTGFNLQLFVQKEIDHGLQQAMKLYNPSGNLGTQEVEALKSGMESIGQLMARIYPALASINLGLISCITTVLFFKAAARRSVPLNDLRFNEFKAPELLVWPAIIAGFAMLVPSPLVMTPALNLLVILGAVYFMQGLAVLFCLIGRTAYQTLLKVFTVILLLTQPYLAMIIAIIGIFDIWGDFRAPRTPTEENL